ncbi:biogenesis of lysosome-related organelles complex 1 subunit 2-like [Gracilinanus agilis]|uniref:biogenesis of lysosome-related organelles complex 1 subunit 2-like n=1 Tax=Gracilinanus agilis TaxID=191870 RepID=UPI001CFE7066|nr:biogenesis of lysosome-related organelles complex 1 subunit 2-like [Gracilinanus agilis]
MVMDLKGKLITTNEDNKLLEKMSKLTTLKYLEMENVVVNISRNLKDLSQKYAILQSYLDQVILTEEQVAYKLETYWKKLEESTRS